MASLWLRRKTSTILKWVRGTSQRESTLNQVREASPLLSLSSSSSLSLLSPLPPPFSYCIILSLSLLVTTIYVRKEEEKVYNAISLRELTLEELKHQVSQSVKVYIQTYRVYIYRNCMLLLCCFKVLENRQVFCFYSFFQISNKYDIPDEMIRFIYKKTKKG